VKYYIPLNCYMIISRHGKGAAVTKKGCRPRGSGSKKIVRSGDKKGTQLKILRFFKGFFISWTMRGRPKKEIAVIHNELARAHTDLSALGYRLMVILAVRATRDGELLTHRLKVTEYKARLGFTGRSAYALLEEIGDQMLKSLVVLENPLEGSRTKFQILSHAKYYDHEGIIELKFHDEMRPLLLKLQQHFTQIPLDVFLRLRSGYAMKMYVRVRSWNPRDTRNSLPQWEMDVDQVRGFLGLDKDEYKEPKFIASGVLKRAMHELNERADLTFRYEPIKEGRRLVGWMFRAIPNTPTITLSVGAAANKRRQEKREEEQIARISSMPAATFETARERWLNAAPERRERWLNKIPEMFRPVDLSATNFGPMFLSALSEIIAEEEAPSLPGLLPGS
jgi:plasmid replication initiation protein